VVVKYAGGRFAPPNLGDYSSRRANELVNNLSDVGVLKGKAVFHAIGDGF
jgi:hypothetical protein